MPIRTILLAACCLLAGCIDSNGPQLGEGTITVEVDALSGRMNPVWSLSPDETGTLASRLRRLELATDSLFEPAEKLGYRGFFLESVRSESGSNRVLIWVGEGFVIDIAPDGSRRVFTDEGIEDLLISMARERGHGQLFEQMEAEAGVSLPSRETRHRRHPEELPQRFTVGATLLEKPPVGRILRTSSAMAAVFALVGRIA